MIKIELVKFEAQDVITASSVPSTPIINPDGSYIKPQPIKCTDPCCPLNILGWEHNKKDHRW